MKSKAKKIIIWTIVGILLVLVAMYIGGYIRYQDKQKTQAAVEYINSRHITLDDVMGTYLPPEPNPAKNNATVAGVDFNNNSIRDDVELAIFKKYPNSAKIRAGMLQYAQVLQLQLTQVFDSDTLIKTIQKRALAYSCLGDADYSSLDVNEALVKNLVLSNSARVNAREDAYKYITTYSLTNELHCDLELSKLPN